MASDDWRPPGWQEYWQQRLELIQRFPRLPVKPAWFVEPIEAGYSGAIIDSIGLLSDGSYLALRVIIIKGDGDQVCCRASRSPGRRIYASCAAGGLVPLLGSSVPVSSHVNVPCLGPVDHPGIGAAIEAAPPGPVGRWMVTTFVIRYHVGIRHYTPADVISLSGCSIYSE